MERAMLLAEESPTILIHWVKYLQWIDRIPLIDYTGAEPDLADIKKQLKEAIQSELLLNQQLNTNTGVIEGSLVFQTSLSVPQLAVFFRLLVEAEILLTDNNRELMRMVAKSFRTSRLQTTISEKHLYDKFYNIDGSALSIMRTHLMKMLQKVQKIGT
jgi:hypothetical protein